MLVKFTKALISTWSHQNIGNSKIHTSQQMASPYKKWVVPEVYPNISLRESVGNRTEEQRQTYHLFWSHGKWGISGGWSLAINKVMMSVKGGGSLNYQLHWVNYSMTHSKYWCPISLWMTNYMRGPTFLFLQQLMKSVRLNGCQVWPTVYLQWKWLCGLLHITSDILIVCQSHIWPFFYYQHQPKSAIFLL